MEFTAFIALQALKLAPFERLYKTDVALLSGNQIKLTPCRMALCERGEDVS